MPDLQDFIKKHLMTKGSSNAVANDKNDIKKGNTLDNNDSQSSSAATKYSNHVDNEKQRLKQSQRSIGFASDIGLTRSADEDSIVVTDLMTAFEGKKRRKLIMILADGMGGHDKGEVASKIGARTLAAELQRFLSDADMSEGKYYELLTSAYSMANRNIMRYADVHPEAEGMGTTISLAIIDEDQQLYIGNVGDSRVYIINREDGAVQLTKDQTFVQELVDKGKITKEDAQRHPKRNILNQAVGTFVDLKVDTCSLRLDDNDYVLLCCDGLTNHVSDDEMAQIVLNDNANPHDACDKIVALANKRGGKDNISVIIAPADIIRT